MNNVRRKYWANAMENGDFFCIETHSGYRSTSRDPKGAHHLLQPDTSDTALGEALLDALSRSRFVLPAPTNDIWIHPDATFDLNLYDYDQSKARYQQLVHDLMERYRYKTKRALFKNMKSCSVTVDEGMMIIRPSFHEKLEGWSGDGISEEDYVVIPANSSPAEVGAALRLAFNRCI